MSRYTETCKEIYEINVKIASLIEKRKKLEKLRDEYIYDELTVEKFDNFYNDEYLLVRIAKGFEIFGGKI